MNQVQPFMQFNEELAQKSGGSDFLQAGGGYTCTIESAIYKAAATGSHGIEFSVKTSDGLKANYITAYYMKADQTPITGGQSLLNAMMGFTGSKGLSFQPANLNGEQVNIIPELTGKTIGLFLQKKLYTKNDGGEGYRFEIRCPFDAQTKQTFKEKSTNKPAEAIARMEASYADLDERNQGGVAQQSESSAMYPDGL